MRTRTFRTIRRPAINAIAGQRLAHAFVLRAYRQAFEARSSLGALKNHLKAVAAITGLTERGLERMSKARLRRLIAQRLSKLEKDLPNDPMLARVTAFGEQFRLGPDEQQILLFAALARASALFNDVAEPLAEDTAVLFALIAAATGLAEGAVRAALGPGATLIASGLLELDPENNISGLAGRLTLLEGVAESLADSKDHFAPLDGRFLSAVPKASLTLDRYEHLRKEAGLAIAVIRGAMQSRTSGVHVLLYGPPGTGKTELARLIVSELGTCGYAVQDLDTATNALPGDQRLRRFAFLQRLLGYSGEAVILFDEVEELLASNDQWGWVSQGRAPASLQKSWKNRLLEGAPVPTIWVANWLYAIDPAILRRFTLAIRVPNPPRAVRLTQLEKRAPAWLNEPGVREAVGADDRLTPADIDRAARAAELSAPATTTEAAEHFVRALALRPGGRPSASNLKTHRQPRLEYRIEWLDTDPPVAEMARLLAARPAARLCFSGPPGAGKTALAKHLAQDLSLPLQAVKASDWLSSWIGETEERIAESFEEAKRDGALLLIDEADSFLRSRDFATRSWEVTEVNQLLKEIEDFDGRLIVCTNHFQTLDRAVLRRLDLKVRFRLLTAKAAAEVFVEAARAVAIPTDAAREVLSRRPLVSGEFSLGDIAVAIRQAHLRLEAPDAELLRDCLEGERRARAEHAGREIGFNANLR